MDVTKHDGAMLVYNFAVVLSGGLLVQVGGLTDRTGMSAVAFAVALLWTVYFRFAMVDRFVDHPRLADEDVSG